MTNLKRIIELIDKENLEIKEEELFNELLIYKKNPCLIENEIWIDNFKIKCSLWSLVKYLYNEELNILNNDLDNSPSSKSQIIIKSFKKLDLIEETQYILEDYYWNKIENIIISEKVLNKLIKKESLDESCLSIDEQYVVAYNFLKMDYNPALTKSFLQTDVFSHLKNIFLSIINNKEKLMNHLNVDEKGFIKLLFNHYLTPLYPKVIDKKLWEELNLDKTLVVKMLFQKNKNKSYYESNKDWLSKMFLFYEPCLILKIGTTKKNFSPFKFFSYKLEEATG